ncbi:DUF4192 domain-containing protein [Streptomyces fungicidicus]|uniref:DUF4192 domain-containing protein n=1 Tax=Streptomyces fungicidicus TaxID=68203 RepID=UPI0036B96ACD
MGELRGPGAGGRPGRRGRCAGPQDPRRAGPARGRRGDAGSGRADHRPARRRPARARHAPGGSELLGYDEAATLILGLQDRTTRDRAAEWMEDEQAGPALRLWRSLARRCVGAYAEHAAAPLTLAGWVAWSTGDELEAREALAMALGADPDYLFARLLHQACNEGLDPESIRRCLRAEREERAPAPRDEPATAGGAEERKQGDGAPPAADPADSGGGASLLPRRRRARVPRAVGGALRRPRAEGGRVPRPRASAGSTRPGGGAAGAHRRRGAPKPGAQAGGRGGDGEE